MSCSNCNSTESFKGKAGDSAYTHWLSEGNVGTLQDFLTSLIGADGTNGIYLLTPYSAPVSNSSGVLQILKSYTLVAANNFIYPFEDGDILEVEGRILTDGTITVKTIGTAFDGNALMTAPMAQSAQTSLTIKHVITRISNVSIACETFISYYNGVFMNINTSASTYIYPIAVSNLDTVDVDIDLTGDGAVAGDITAMYWTVKLIKQP